METIDGLNRRQVTERYENRFLVTEDQAREVMQVVSRNLAPAAYDCMFPWRTTTYCDTPDWKSYRSAVAGEETTRLRFREYHVSCPDQVFSGETTWVELKGHSSATPERRVKRRVQIPCAVVPALLRGDAASLTGLDEAAGEAKLLVDAGARPVLVTQYSRVAFATPGDRIRITADYNLSYLHIPWSADDDDPIPCPIGLHISRESGVVIEVKYSDELPHWAVALSGLLSETSSGERASKFVTGAGQLWERRVSSS